MAEAAKIARLTAANTTTTFFPFPCGVTQIVICVEAASGQLEIRDQAGTPHQIVATHTNALGTDGLPEILNFEKPVPMQGGVDVVTSGGGSPDVTVCIHVVRNADIPT